jgi:membrane-bound metal-dependent hydrolase YbcI (DUF457 family)
MSLPILHSFAGYTVYRFSRRQEDQPDWKVAAYCVVLANAADLDFVPGILIQNAGQFHHGVSHSFGAAFICGLFAALIAKIWKKRAVLQSFILTTSAYATHIILDYINDCHTGMLLLWPLSGHRFAPKFIAWAYPAMGPMQMGGAGAFIRYLLTMGCLRRAMIELLLMGSFFIFVWSYGEFNRLLRKQEFPFILRNK